MDEILKNKKLVGGSSVVLLLLGAGVWYYLEFLGAANQPFTLIKDWRHKEQEFTVFSEAAQWVHQQCHEPMMKKSPLGNPVPLAAKEVIQKAPNTWSFTIHPEAKFSDGSAVMAEHFEKTFALRKTKVLDPVFQRIGAIRAIEPKVFELEVTDATNPDDVAQTLTSIWVTSLKSTEGAWSWDREISGPCDGPFVPSIAAFDTLNMKRNKYWHSYDKSLLRRISVLARPETKSSAAEMFRSGKLTYLDQSIDPNLKSDFTGKRNSFLDPAAWYLVVNSGGAFAKKLTPFMHHVLNRGELESVVTDGRFFKVMYGLVPWSFVDSDGRPLYGGFPETGVESLIEARKDLGIPITAAVTEIKPSFNRALRIYSPGDDKISPVVQRFAERLKTNFNIDSELISELPETSDDAVLDLAFLEVQFERDLTRWAEVLLKQHEALFPVPAEIKSKLKVLVTMVSQPSVIDEQTTIMKALDGMPIERRTIIPLGQFASAYLLAPSVSGVEVRGDPRQDPDVRLARWVSGSR